MKPKKMSLKERRAAIDLIRLGCRGVLQRFSNRERIGHQLKWWEREIRYAAKRGENLDEFISELVYRAALEEARQS